MRIRIHVNQKNIATAGRRRYNVPIDVHLEIDNKTLSPFETVLQNRPNARIILAHSGRADTQTLKGFLSKYANLFVEVSCNMATCAYGQLEPESWRKNPHEDGKGNLLPEWKSFYEEWADRIVGLGTDFYRPTNYENNAYGPAMNRWRQLLWKNLSESAMRKIAYKNAEKMFLGMEW